MKDQPSLRPTDSGQSPFALPTLSKRITIIVGGYGSGKSEVAVNLARFLVVDQTESVAIADLDIINPYFRSREAAAELESFGVHCLLPEGDRIFADLPIIVPEIKTSIERGKGRLILDVGGDDVGAKVLSSLADAFGNDDHDLCFVHNARRPFTSDLPGSLRVMQEIEHSSRLRFTGIISNTHLLTDTDAECILGGLALAKLVSRETNLPIVFLSALRSVLTMIPKGAIDVPVLQLDRALVKPWERRGNTWTDRKLRIH
jgi:hypothetical protein